MESYLFLYPTKRISYDYCISTKFHELQVVASYLPSIKASPRHPQRVETSFLLSEQGLHQHLSVSTETSGRLEHKFAHHELEAMKRSIMLILALQSLGVLNVLLQIPYWKL
jgi:hypothetical protein